MLITRDLPSKVSMRLSPPSVSQCYLGVDDVEARGWGGDGCRSSVDTHYEGLLDGWRDREEGESEMCGEYLLVRARDTEVASCPMRAPHSVE